MLGNSGGKIVGRIHAGKDRTRRDTGGGEGKGRDKEEKEKDKEGKEKEMEREGQGKGVKQVLVLWTLKLNLGSKWKLSFTGYLTLKNFQYKNGMNDKQNPIYFEK